MNTIDPRVYNLFPSSWIGNKSNFNIAKYDLTYTYNLDVETFKSYDRVLLEFKCTLRYKSLYKLFFNTTYTFRSSIPYLESMGYMGGGDYMPTIKGISLLFLLEKNIPVSYETLKPSYIEEWNMILDQEALFNKFYRIQYYEIDKNYIRPKK